MDLCEHYINLYNTCIKNIYKEQKYANKKEWKYKYNYDPCTY